MNLFKNKLTESTMLLLICSLSFSGCGILSQPDPTDNTYYNVDQNLDTAYNQIDRSSIRYQMRRPAAKHPISYKSIDGSVEHATVKSTYIPAQAPNRPDYPSLSEDEIDHARAKLGELMNSQVKKAQSSTTELRTTNVQHAQASNPEITKTTTVNEDNNSRGVTIQAKVNTTQVNQNSVTLQKTAVPIKKTDLVAPGYLIQLVALDDEKLNGSFRVNFNGMLKLPYGVNIQTSSLSEKELSASIGNAYKKYFKAEPDLQVSVIERDLWVDVRGLVKKSGKFLVKEDTSLDEVLAKAGGLQRDTLSNSLAQYVRINQSGADTAVVNMEDYYAGASYNLPIWQGGDTVFAQTRASTQQNDGRAQLGNIEQVEQFIQLAGQVKHPGRFAYKSGQDFFYYLVQAGGPTEKADLNRLMIVREEMGQKQTIKANLEDLSTLPDIQPGDLLLLNGDVRDSSEKNLTIFTSLSQVVTSIASVVVLAFAI